MAAIHIRDVDDALIVALKLRARRNGASSRPRSPAIALVAERRGGRSGYAR